jgi:cytochrome c biogenesis factor
MLVELGHYALILALLLAVAQACFGLAGPALGRERWLAAVPSAATGQFVFLVLAAGVLLNAFVQDDFSVRYAITFTLAQGVPPQINGLCSHINGTFVHSPSLRRS